jgi:hypothetical protein
MGDQRKTAHGAASEAGVIELILVLRLLDIQLGTEAPRFGGRLPINVLHLLVVIDPILPNLVVHLLDDVLLMLVVGHSEVGVLGRFFPLD